MQRTYGAVSAERVTQLKRFLRRNKTGWLFVAPFLILFVVFNLLPVLSAARMSLYHDNMIQAPVKVGMENYARLLLDDDVFLLALRNTFIFALFIGPLGYLLSFFMAWCLNGLKFRNFFALIFYAPSITSGVAMTQVWLYIFSNDSYGLVNYFLLRNGLINTPILWNQSATYIFPAVILISVWMSMGTGFLVFMAGLQNLPGEVLEQGRIDGIKNRFTELIYLIFPMMKPQLLFGAINAIVGSFTVFDVVVQFAGMPSPNYAAHTIVAHLYDHAFLRFEMGYASAVAVVLFLITFILGQVCMRVFRSDE